MTDTTPEVVDATIVEDAPGMELEHRPAPQLLMPLAEPAEVRAAMVAYQQTLDSVLDPTDWQGAPGQRGSFVKKSGWRKIAKAFGLSVTIVHEDVVRDDQGEIVRAKVIARAVAPNGQMFDGDGYCSITESRFNAASGRQKIENDLPATATTRAMNRAISGLVGFGEVSEEEASTAAAAPWGDPATQAQGEACQRALAYLLGPAGTAYVALDVLAQLMARFDGKLPAAAALAIAQVAAAHRDNPAEATP